MCGGAVACKDLRSVIPSHTVTVCEATRFGDLPTALGATGQIGSCGETLRSTPHPCSTHPRRSVAAQAFAGGRLGVWQDRYPSRHDSYWRRRTGLVFALKLPGSAGHRTGLVFARKLRGSAGDPEGIRGDPWPEQGIQPFEALRFVGDPAPPISPCIILKSETGSSVARSSCPEARVRASRALEPAV